MREWWINRPPLHQHLQLWLVLPFRNNRAAEIIKVTNELWNHRSPLKIWSGYAELCPKLFKHNDCNLKSKIHVAVDWNRLLSKHWKYYKDHIVVFVYPKNTFNRVSKYSKYNNTRKKYLFAVHNKFRRFWLNQSLIGSKLAIKQIKELRILDDSR